MKLSNKQKEVIKLMRTHQDIFSYDTENLKYQIDWKPISISIGDKLKLLGIIEVSKQTFGIRFYKLTELGKTIDL